MLNKVMLIGNLGAKPELRYTANNKSVATFSMATSKHWTNNEGEKQEKTEWHSIVVWGKLAEPTHKFLEKGSRVYIEGELQTRSWDDESNKVKRYKTEIVAYTVNFLDRPKPKDQTGNPLTESIGNVSNDAPQVEDDLPF